MVAYLGGVPSLRVDVDTVSILLCVTNITSSIHVNNAT